MGYILYWRLLRNVWPNITKVGGNFFSSSIITGMNFPFSHLESPTTKISLHLIFQNSIILTRSQNKNSMISCCHCLYRPWYSPIQRAKPNWYFYYIVRRSNCSFGHGEKEEQISGKWWSNLYNHKNLIDLPGISGMQKATVDSIRKS